MRPCFPQLIRIVVAWGTAYHQLADRSSSGCRDRCSTLDLHMKIDVVQTGVQNYPGEGPNHMQL
eukprot:6569085-Pyramimonas_sp.AAC.1